MRDLGAFKSCAKRLENVKIPEIPPARESNACDKLTIRHKRFFFKELPRSILHEDLFYGAYHENRLLTASNSAALPKIEQRRINSLPLETSNFSYEKTDFLTF